MPALDAAALEAEFDRGMVVFEDEVSVSAIMSLIALFDFLTLNIMLTNLAK